MNKTAQNIHFCGSAFKLSTSGGLEAATAMYRKEKRSGTKTQAASVIKLQGTKRKRKRKKKGTVPG